MSQKLHKFRLTRDPSGKDIFEEYNSKSVLSTKSRKKLVSIVVKDLVSIKKRENGRLSGSDKCAYAQAIISLFPLLKSTLPGHKLGYEHFYKPINRTGFIQAGLGNAVRRDTDNSSTVTVGSSGTVNNDQSRNTDEVKNKNDYLTDIQDSISFMQHAIPHLQKIEIIEKTIQTFEYRRTNFLNIEFFTCFPRFKDMCELIPIEFNLMHPNINSNALNDSFGGYIAPILKLYNLEKGNQNTLEWNHATNSFVALTQLLPPVAKGKKKTSRLRRESVVDNLFIFLESGTPLETLKKRQT